MTTENIDYASYVDHTLLAMDATELQIAKLCEEAQQHNFYAVCVNSGYVPLAAQLLQESTVKVCSVIGFPLGAGLTVAKAFEAKAAIAAGARDRHGDQRRLAEERPAGRSESRHRRRARGLRGDPVEGNIGDLPAQRCADCPGL